MSSFRAIFCALLVWCAAGCAKSETAPKAEVAKPEVAKPEVVAATTDAAPVRTESLTFVPSELVAGDAEGSVKHCLNCRVRTATYEYCHFELSALNAAVGEANLSSQVTAKVAMTPLASETFKPKDPNAPQPEGGFVHDAFSCRILEIE
jgi:Tfp pilus assembly major pilin PilA